MQPNKLRIFIRHINYDKDMLDKIARFVYDMKSADLFDVANRFRIRYSLSHRYLTRLEKQGKVI